MSKNIKKKTIKLIAGIIIPIFIMVTSIVMVGVSYAWFSASTATTISTITMANEEAFTLTFNFGDDPEEMYEGQLAYVTKNTITHLVTDEYATDVLGYTNPSTIYDGYMLDKPYKVGTNVILDTQGKIVDFEVHINSINIYMEETENEVTTKTYLMQLNSTDSVNLIPYGFTWYILDSANNRIYTPYGTSSEGNSLTVTGTTVSEKWFSTPNIQNITNFSSTNESAMQLFVVFCPEKLYWMQYSLGKTFNSTADWRAGLEDIYTTTNERNMIYHLDSYGNTADGHNPSSNPDTSGVTYWDPKYVGAQFEFNFTVNVLNVHKD